MFLCYALLSLPYRLLHIWQVSPPMLGWFMERGGLLRFRCTWGTSASMPAEAFCAFGVVMAAGLLL